MLEGFSAFTTAPATIWRSLTGIFFMANFLFSMLLILFTVFFCVRSVSDTKKAVFLMAVSLLFMFMFSKTATGQVVDVFLFLFNGVFIGQLGLIGLILSVVLVLVGMRDEERSMDYVHSRFYWVGSAVIAYVSLVFISTVMNGEKVENAVSLLFFG